MQRTAAQALTIDQNGWLVGGRRVESPNADERPDGSRVSLIVIHNISLPPGRYGGGEVERLFTNGLDPRAHALFERLDGVHVSCHFFIDRVGDCTQYVSCLRRAWHAGASAFRGRSRCNDFSIGIELEGTDFEPFTDAQYAMLNRLLRALRAAYPIAAIVGHSDIAADRKTDPGPCFSWARLEVPVGLLAR